MKIGKDEYVFQHINDPPGEYGFGMRTNDYEFWITPGADMASTTIFKRKIGDKEVRMGYSYWVLCNEIERDPLRLLGTVLGMTFLGDIVGGLLGKRIFFPEKDDKVDKLMIDVLQLQIKKLNEELELSKKKKDVIFEESRYWEIMKNVAKFQEEIWYARKKKEGISP